MTLRARHIACPAIGLAGFLVALLWIAHPWISVAGMAVCVGACVWGVVSECWESR